MQNARLEIGASGMANNLPLLEPAPHGIQMKIFQQRVRPASA
jgi:hypothetical protein